MHRARALAHTAPGGDEQDAEITDAIERLHDARGAIHRHTRGEEAA